MNWRLAKSADAMALDYPDLSFVLDQTAEGEVGVWRGRIQPVRSLDAINDILDDVAHDRSVRVVAGEIRHHRNCAAVHCHHDWMDRLVYWRIKFEIEVRYNGGRGDPRCWVRWPPLVQLHERTPHIWGDGSICPFLSSEGWDYDRDDVVDFMGHVAVWLVKWVLWEQTGFWIGSQHRADPEYHLRAIDPEDPCWCRSGAAYRCCHFEHDRRAAADRRAQARAILGQTPAAKGAFEGLV